MSINMDFNFKPLVVTSGGEKAKTSSGLINFSILLVLIAIVAYFIYVSLQFKNVISSYNTLSKPTTLYRIEQKSTPTSIEALEALIENKNLPIVSCCNVNFNMESGKVGTVYTGKNSIGYITTTWKDLDVIQYGGVAFAFDSSFVTPLQFYGWYENISAKPVDSRAYLLYRFNFKDNGNLWHGLCSHPDGNIVSLFKQCGNLTARPCILMKGTGGSSGLPNPPSSTLSPFEVDGYKSEVVNTINQEVYNFATITITPDYEDWYDTL